MARNLRPSSLRRRAACIRCDRLRFTMATAHDAAHALAIAPGISPASEIAGTERKECEREPEREREGYNAHVRHTYLCARRSCILRVPAFPHAARALLAHCCCCS